jgi:hypothetical protein
MPGMTLLVLALATAHSGNAFFDIPLRHESPPVKRGEYRQANWRLNIRRDTFSGKIVCRLRSRGGDVRFASGALAFRFPQNWSVTQAVYRIDNAPPRAWREDISELIRIGAPFDQGGVANPSSGQVWIPLSKLSVANVVAIEARPDRAPRTFRISGIEKMLTLAGQHGCSPAATFVQ